MFAPAAPILARLAALPPLAGWAVRSVAEEGSRKTLPAIELECIGAEMQDARNGAALVAVEWAVHLVVGRSATAFAQLDAAFAAVIGALHHWTPGTAAPSWSPLMLARVNQPEIVDQGLIAYSISFTTQAVYRGTGA